ncbi:hypothetical protein HOY82DRAFT_579161 [Tuber indicum]|nr:hypothetical protein HOY82DRAFT_579161 [Tuber indicum]
MNRSSTVDASKSPSSGAGQDTNGGAQLREDIILTPASTTMSEGSEGERNERREAEGGLTRPTEDNAEMGEPKMDNNNNRRDNIPEVEDWAQYTPSRNNRDIREEMGSLNNEIPNLKELFARTSSAMDEEADHLTRVKANHRSSLASLAESHRTEISNLTASHQNEIKKLEESHVEEMRNARRGYGFNNDLVRGLHESYGKQIESLVLDLGEARRQLKMKLGSISSTSSSPMATKSSVSSFPDEGPLVHDILARRLPMVLNFGDLDKALSTTEISIPHPGSSFRAVYKHLCHAAKNHLQALDAAAELFATGAKWASEVRKIKHWYQSALEERIHFRILNESGGSNIKDLWETGLWKADDFILQVDCAAEEAWPKVHVYDEGIAEQRKKLTSPSGGRPSSLRSQSRTSFGLTSEQLIEVEGETSRGFDATAELERINRELGELEVHDHLRHAGDENKENIDGSVPKRFVTVEEVVDEDDPVRAAGEGAENEDVGLSAPSSPTPTPKEPGETTVPLGWMDNNNIGDKMGSSSRAASNRSLFSKFLEEDLGTGKRDKRPTSGSNASDSWRFDDLFSSPTERKKGKERSTVSSDESLQDRDEQTNGARGPQPWRWILTPGGTVITPPQYDSDNQAPKVGTQSFERASAPRLGRLNEEDTEDEHIISESDQPDVEQEELRKERKRRKPFFLFGEGPAASPAPPPAPEPSTRKSPTLPAYLRAEMESSYQSTRIDDDSDIDDNQPREADIENAFSKMKPGPCDTPVMGNSRTAVSLTPLLGDRSPTPRRGGPSLRLDTDNFKATRGPGERSAPMPKAANPSASTKGPKYRGGGGSYGYPGPSHVQEGGGLDEPWESASEGSASGKWGSRRGNRCGHGKGPSTRTWRRDLDSEDFRSRSVSPQIPPPSRSSMTTTDRSADFVPPPQAYQHNIGSGSGSNGPVRYGGVRYMGPLGPTHMRNYAGAHQADMIFHQQMKNPKELFAAGYRPNGPPPFISPMGPVYAPNPPHSVSAFGSGAMGRSPAFLLGNNEQRVASENGGNWPMRPPLTAHPQFGPHMWNLSGEGPRRSYSTDSISPHLWKLDAEGGLQQAPGPIPGPTMPPQRPGSTIADQTAYQNQINASLMSALANGYAQQPSTPGSHGSVVGQMPGPQWFLNMQQAQAQAQAQMQGNPTIPPGFEAWTSSPIGGMPGQWAIGPFSS